MNGYSKMKIIGTTKSRSMDFSSDLLSSFSETSNTKTKIPETKHQQQQSKNKPLNNNNNNNIQDSFSFLEQEEEEEEEEDYHQECNSNNNSEEKFDSHIKLSRNSSVSSSASALQSAVKRAFSMRRSSSVSERYSRIHDQSVTLSSPTEDHEDGEVFEMGRTRSVKILKKKKNNKSKILKACKKIFGL